MSTRAEHPTAVVTGGSRRIGAAIVEELHQRGCNVIIHYHSGAEAAQSLAARLNQDREGSASILQADLTDKQGPEALVKGVASITSKLCLLVNNASRFYPTPVGEVTFDAWRDLMGSNTRGAFFLSQALIPLLGGGAIVNILDVHARKPMRNHTVYCMAKAALEMMTLSLAKELAPTIRVNGVSPGAILWPESDPDDAEKNAILSRIALQRAGEPGDIARAVAYLGLDAPYVTGQVLAVDGGRSLNI